MIRHEIEGESVRIEVEMGADNVLLSDFHLWHYCMCYWYLSASRADNRRFDKELRERELDYFKTKPLPDPVYHARIEQSWERILDLEWAGPDKAHPSNDKCIQAVFWELRLEQVREVTHFRGTWRDRKLRP